MIDSHKQRHTNDSESRAVDGDDIPTVACAFAVSAVSATLLARSVFHADFIHDPVEVVGRPIMDGYSERSEQLAWLVFWSATLLVSIVTTSLLRRTPATISRRIGLIAVLLIPVASGVADHRRFEVLVMYAVITTALTIGLLSIRSGRTCRDLRLERWLWGSVFLYLIWRSSPAVLAAVLVPQLFTALIVVLLLIAWTLHRHPEWLEFLTRWSQAIRKSEWMPLVLLGGSVLLLTAAERSVLPLAGVTVCAAQIAGRANGPIRIIGDVSSMIVLLCAMLSAACINWWYTYRTSTSDILLMSLCSAACAVTVVRRQDRLVRTVAELNQLWSSRRVSSLLVAAGLVIPFVFHGWWTAAVLTIVAAVVICKPVSVRPRFTQAVMVAAGLLVAFVPSIGSSGPADAFHDGQILSAVWEFESGRPLYSEVFPLRSFEFFVAVAGRSFLPPTLEGFRAAYRLLTFLPVAGGLLLGFTWTRSTLWGLAAALAVSTQPMYARQGALLVLAAVVLEILRSDRRSLWMLLGIPGALCCLCGFDGIGSVGLAAGGAVFLSAKQSNSETVAGFGFAAARGLKDTCIVLPALILPFTALLALLVDSQAAVTYWTLFADFSRHLNAFYGLSVPVDGLLLYRGLLPMLFLLTVWNAVYGSCRKRMSESRSRTWLFVSLFIFFATLRAVGRGDTGHFDCTVYPPVVLAVLLLYEFLGFVRRLGHRGPFTDRRVAAAILIIFAAWNVPRRTSDPLTLVSQYRDLAATETADLDVNTSILDVLDTDDWLWPVENGISTYAHQRHNPTRHAIAFAMSTPNEQRNVVAALKRHSPRLIEWPTTAVEIAVPLRYYIISPYVYEHYRPARQSGYLAPVGVDPRPIETFPEEFREPIDTGRLPYVWGARRLPRLRQIKPERLAPAADSAGADAAGTTNTSWVLATPAKSQKFNYLWMRIRCQGREQESSEWSGARISFLSSGADHAESAAVIFLIRADGRAHDYLVPIGCSPVWNWQSQIDRLQIEPEFPQAELLIGSLLRIDDSGQHHVGDARP